MSFFNFLGGPADKLPSGYPHLRCSLHCFAKQNNAFGGATIPTAFAIIFILCALNGCSKNKANTDAAVQSQQSAETNGQLNQTDTSVDFDLTSMNPNMIYAQVFNLMLSPEDYDGKIFKMTGSFLKLTGQDGETVYAVIVKDALACCQQGLEFKYDFAGNEPQPEQNITVTGKYTLTTRPDGLSHNYIVASLVN